MRVRFLGTYEPVTTFYRDLLPYLAERSVISEVLISAAEYREGGRARLSDVFSHSSIRVKYLPALRMQPTGRVWKGFIMLAYALGAASRTLVGASADVNILLTQPPLFSLWGWLLRKLRRQPYVCVTMDIYPDVAVNEGILSPQGMVGRLLTRISRVALQQADAVVAIGRCMAERLAAKGVSEERIHLIPNWANPQVAYPIPSSENRLRHELGLTDKFVHLYSGNMGVSHYFDDLLEVIGRCRQNPRLHFVFIGDGSQRQKIENFTSRLRARNVTFLPFQPLERLAESLGLGDVHFVSLREGFEGLVVPSKAYAALAAGRPMIYQGRAAGEVARMIVEEDVGVVIPHNAPDQLEMAIHRYAANPDLAKKQGEAARGLALGKYAATAMLERYYHVISQVVHA